MHQSFVTTALHLWGRMGDSWPTVRGNNFLIFVMNYNALPLHITISPSLFLTVPQYRGSEGVLTLGSLPQGEGRAKSIALTSKLSPMGGAYNRALKTDVNIPALPHRWGGGGLSLKMTGTLKIECSFQLISPS